MGRVSLLFATGLVLVGIMSNVPFASSQSSTVPGTMNIDKVMNECKKYNRISISVLVQLCLKLDLTKVISDKTVEDIIRTACSPGNTGPNGVGVINVGVFINLCLVLKIAGIVVVNLLIHVDVLIDICIRLILGLRLIVG